MLLRGRGKGGVGWGVWRRRRGEVGWLRSVVKRTRVNGGVVGGVNSEDVGRWRG